MTLSSPKPGPIAIGEGCEHFDLRALVDLLAAAADHCPRNEKEEGPKRIDRRQQ
jgi:hypothetical protein